MLAHPQLAVKERRLRRTMNGRSVASQLQQERTRQTKLKTKRATKLGEEEKAAMTPDRLARVARMYYAGASFDKIKAAFDGIPESTLGKMIQAVKATQGANLTRT
jgi:hypothetical protein